MDQFLATAAYRYHLNPVTKPFIIPRHTIAPLNQCSSVLLPYIRMRKTSNNIVAPVIAVGVLLPCCPAAHVVILSQINFAAILASIPS